MARSLGSSKATHTERGHASVREIERSAKRVIEAVKEGKCTAASLAKSDMHRAEGAAYAHMHAGGKGIWIPQTTLSEASVAFNERCVIPVVADPELLTPLSGARRRKQRR
jgi:hypothetical protein